MDTTTGMSAPPIGMMSRKPSAKAISAISQNRESEPVDTNPTTSATIRTPSPRFSQCWPGKMIGAPLINACSLAKAMTEPEKVTAPMARPSDISTSDPPWMSPRVPMPKLSGA
jgi:hypothetical protein